MTRIYLSPPDVRHLEGEYVAAALESGWLAPVGPDLDAFEREIAAATGVTHAVGLSSGTAALHLALKEADVGPGDSVLLPTFTFVATANAVTYVGATPVFIDSDPISWNLSADLLCEELTARAQQGRMPKACIAVDVYGNCADYGRIVPLLRDYGVTLIEDAAEALGATYGGRPAGGLGDCGVVSFNGNKVITSSSGGMFLSNDAGMAERVRYLATQARQLLPYYEHLEVGFNYRLSNVLAALGRAQLATLDARIGRRQEIRESYTKALAGIPGIGFQPIESYGEPNCWLTCIVVDPAAAGFDREQLRRHLEAGDIESRPLWKPMHLQPIYGQAPNRVDGTAEALFESGLCLPSGSGMTDTQLEYVIERIVSCSA